MYKYQTRFRLIAAVSAFLLSFSLVANAKDNQGLTETHLNTSEPYHSVGACREYGGKLAEIKEQHDD